MRQLVCTGNHTRQNCNSTVYHAAVMTIISVLHSNQDSHHLPKDFGVRTTVSANITNMICLQRLVCASNPLPASLRNTATWIFTRSYAPILCRCMSLAAHAHACRRPQSPASHQHNHVTQQNPAPTVQQDPAAQTAHCHCPNIVTVQQCNSLILQLLPGSQAAALHAYSMHSIAPHAVLRCQATQSTTTSVQ
jgi:hypothetical protein